jgi:hypothetical protein
MPRLTRAREPSMMERGGFFPQEAVVRLILASAWMMWTAGVAAAAGPVFSEDWESGTSSWQAADANPINVSSDPAPGCSTNFQHETVGYAGGRVFTKSAIVVTMGNPYCLSGWIRASSGTFPYLGVVESDALADRGLVHWLMGSDGFGATTPVTSDGQWHWNAASFNAPASFILVVDELFSGGAAGSADFDDIELWNGSCPGAPPGADAHQACTTSAPLCNGSGACVGCGGDDNNCSAFPSTPACQADGSCNQCNGKPGQCTSPSLTTCDTTSGTCVLCTAGDASACAGNSNGTACITSGPFCGCNSDSDCGSATSGRVCDTVSHQCHDGCRGSGGNGCPGGQFCTSSNASPGTCTMSCNFDVNCTDSTKPHCFTDPDGGTNSCVACRDTDTDCTSGALTLCDGTTHSCAQCTATRLSACTSDGPGDVCRVGGTCGCNDTSNCDPANPARACDVASHLCITNNLDLSEVADAGVPNDLAVVTVDDLGMMKRRDMSGKPAGDLAIVAGADLSAPSGDMALTIGFLGGGGCTGCVVAGHERINPLGLLVMVGLVLLLARRRRSTT